MGKCVYNTKVKVEEELDGANEKPCKWPIGRGVDNPAAESSRIGPESDCIRCANARKRSRDDRNAATLRPDRRPFRAGRPAPRQHRGRSPGAQPNFGTPPRRGPG